MKKIFKKFFLIFIVIIFFCIFLCLGLYSTMQYMKISTESQRFYPRGISNVPTTDYILVPGAQILYTTPSPYLCHRLDSAYELYINKKSCKIIVSGGFDENILKYETEIMKKYLISLGIPEDDIISDLNGNSTYETLKRTKDFIKDKSIIFCTQKLYSYRACFIANNLNLNMYVYCCDPYIYSHNGKNSIRESFAQIKAIVDCKLWHTSAISLEQSPFI